MFKDTEIESITCCNEMELAFQLPKTNFYKQKEKVDPHIK